MTQPGTESTLIRERLLPQMSIRFFAMLIAFSAVAMYVLRAGFVHQRLWAVIGSMLIVAVITTFIVYAGLFVIANVFSRSTRAVFAAIFGQDSKSSIESVTRGEAELARSSAGEVGDPERGEVNADGT